jgi:plasmid stabilization system protein ParE
VTRVTVSRRADEDMARLCAFLSESLPHEASRTSDLVHDALLMLQSHPEIGRPVGSGLRELVISRGRTGYLALYWFDADEDLVIVLRLRHQREAGYGS